MVAWAGVLWTAPQAALAQATPFGEIATPDVVIGRIGLGETARKAWGIDEADWQVYRELMAGPSGLWYPHLPPAMVLGINATTGAERRRFARIVRDQERQKLDALFEFNRTYQAIARSERERPGFSLFDESLLRSPVRQASRTPVRPERVIAFVGPDCPRCDSAVRTLAAAGTALDVYYVDAASDGEIRSWARRIGIPVERVRSRTVTLNHDAGNRLGRSGYARRDLPLLFDDASLERPIGLAEILGASGG